MNNNLSFSDDFPQLKRKIKNDIPLVYFDNAATSLRPRVVIDAITEHMSHNEANIHRGIHTLSELGTTKFEEVREKVQSLINAKQTHEVIFTKGTTESINLVAQSYGSEFLKPGDEILVDLMAHHSNLVPWQIIAEKTGAKVIEIPINNDGELLMEEYKKLLNEKTKFVSVTHVSNTLGTINDVKEMTRLAHNVGAKVAVDGAQAIAHLTVDVADIDCDFYAFSAHKMLGPTGVGVLYGKEDILNSMPPYQGGGAMISTVSFKGSTWNSLPHKFEAGTPAIAAVIALGPAIDYLTNIGFSKISEIENDLLQYATEKMKNVGGITIYGNAENKASVISFTMDGAHPNDLAVLLDQQGVAIRTGHHCTYPLLQFFGLTATARASFMFYNTKEEIDQFINALEKVKKFI
jgi:cysteine desulfurase / selenocysteine lyase